MNENLSAALLRAGLTVEDIAARLAVDPKSVRRWLDGRVPFLRHRWALARLLDMREADLWPRLHAAQSRPTDVHAVYPRLDAVPPALWLSLFESAEREIAIIDDGRLPFGTEVVKMLRRRASAGVCTRLCLAPEQTRLDGSDHCADARTIPASSPESASWIKALAADAGLQIRLHRAPVYNSIYQADDQLLVSHRVYGIQSGSGVVMHLQHEEASVLAGVYVAEFERVWAESIPSGADGSFGWA